MVDKADKHAPWLPAKYEQVITSSFKAVAVNRNATPEQMEIVLNWIINDLCRTHDMSFRPGNPEATTFAEAKRFVGNQIIKQINLVTKD